MSVLSAWQRGAESVAGRVLPWGCRDAGRLLAAAALWLCAGASPIPGDLRMSTSDQVLTFSSGDRVVSTATVCRGYTFDQLGVGGPKFSPDFHFVLVDVLGPFEPGDVPRNHALISVATGGIVFAPNFPHYAGVPMTLDPLSWASGQRATLRYTSGKTEAVHELLPFPVTRCAPSTTRRRGASHF